MVCIVEFEEGIRFNFAQNKYLQKVWVEALKHCFNKDIAQLAYLLDIPQERLAKVHQGVSYLPDDKADELAKLFLIAFGD
ncbi:hypothetical protein Lsan_3855 [Legionella santicrucis]|uniref:XRE family transcriptional regulator n=1 Tax=Legionella santicrucis TaxID=45074 RepID=A0A0W0Y986_9GAMM|nr:hypothetical protein [Legionella santicrucis]KTD53445.1 hypothetical protein Lsan_3855 [Legionella santicrucis]